MNCLNCERAKYCSDKCRMAYVRRTPEQPEHEHLPEQKVPEQRPEQVVKNDAVPVGKMTKDELYLAIECYEHDDWIESPEFEELMHRLNTWKYERLEAEGYKIPAWLYHKNNPNRNK